eukprot:scaffold143925_cov52-Attheya_sp.AAC.3
MEFLTKLPDEVGRHIVGFLDVPTLVKKKAVCRSWRALFTDTIERKASTPQPFESGDELRFAVKQYAYYNPNDPDDFFFFSEQHMDGPSGGGMYPVLRILTAFFKTVSLSTRASDRRMCPTLHQWRVCLVAHPPLTKIFLLGTPRMSEI